MTAKEEFLRLVERYTDGTASPKELEALDRYYLLFADQPEITARLSEKAQAQLAQRMEDGLMDRVYRTSQRGHTVKLWPRIAAAASILVLLGTGAYFYFHQQQAQPVAQLDQNDRQPGHHQATLTLANGKQIILTKGLHGQLAVQGHTTIQADNNDITYNNTQKEAVFSYNTLTTRVGEQSPYPLVLADGTKVWLNAASSITFPTAFNGKERLVKITGQAYFEVAHKADQPFKVTAGKLTIEDLGTQFDINAYADEPVVRTTLVQGRVKVSDAASTATLQPGEQATAKEGAPIKVTRNVNTAVITAWKNGFFRFEEAGLPAITREFARWYDVEVVFEGPPKPDQEYDMKVTRAATLKRALHILTEGGVHYRLEGKKLIINP